MKGEVLLSEVLLSFDEALRFLKDNHSLTRKGWNGKGMYIYHVCQRLPYMSEEEAGGTWSEFIVMKTADNNLIPWVASQTDILAEDWIIYKP